MGIFDFFKFQTPGKDQIEKQETSRNNAKEDDFVKSDSVAEDERPYYHPDEYYTFYSYPNTGMGKKVILFDERKLISNPSTRGLYVAEILLLEYVRMGQYPKPKSGYPAFWWFEYGIRDVGHALESLANRGFIQWASKMNSIKALKVDELKQILSDNGLSIKGRKNDLISRIKDNVKEQYLNLPDSAIKYELTPLGEIELNDNGYVPYMHKHPYKTTEGSTFGVSFNVWSINSLLSDRNAADWKKIVGALEIEQFGVDMTDSNENVNTNSAVENHALEKEELRYYLLKNKDFIDSQIKNGGSGFDEEIKGINLARTGNHKDALIQFYIAIGKRFDAPALYKECAKLLIKYEMYDEALGVIEKGFHYVPGSNKHREELNKLKSKTLKLMNR